MSPRTVVRALGPVTAAALLLVACGDDSGNRGDDGAALDSGSGPGADLTVEAHDTEFDRDAYRAAAGSVAIDYVQEGELPHTLVIEAPDGGDVDGFELEVGADDADRGTLDLAPGDYVIYCDVPGHRDAGMEAELRVE